MVPQTPCFPNQTQIVQHFSATEKNPLIHVSEDTKVNAAAWTAFKDQFVQLGTQSRVKCIEIYDHQKAAVIQENGERIEVLAPFIELPSCPQSQLPSYLEKATFKIHFLSDGSYKITSGLSLLGGGKERGIHKEAKKGNVEKIKKIISEDIGKKKKYTIDERTEKGETALHIACKSYEKEKTTPQARFEMVKLLVESGADVNAVGGEDESTPFLVACSYGHWEVANYLLPAVKDIFFKNNQGRTALHKACNYRNEEMIEKLLKMMDLDKKSAFMWGVKNAQHEVVKYFNNKTNGGLKNLKEALTLARESDAKERKYRFAEVIEYLSSCMPKPKNRGVRIDFYNLGVKNPNDYLGKIHILDDYIKKNP